MADLKERLIEEIEKIDGLEVRDSELGIKSTLVYEGKEFAHFHDANELDIRLTKGVIKQHGLTHPPDSSVHPNRSANSPWIELRFTTLAEVKKVAGFVRLATQVL